VYGFQVIGALVGLLTLQGDSDRTVILDSIVDAQYQQELKEMSFLPHPNSM
jgi:hypothetical protein